MLAPGFTIRAELFALSFIQGNSAGNDFTIQTSNNTVKVICPQAMDYTDTRLQDWLRKVVVEQLRLCAKVYLPQRLHKLAQTHTLNYNKITITSPRTRWGSCSSRKNISLSLYLLLLPSHLIDYVILHELCHTVELNHSSRFWTLLDKFTDKQSLKLRKELHAFTFPF